MKDSSLKYHPKYYKWEVLFSEVHNRPVRYVGHVGEFVKVAELDSISEIKGLIPQDNVCRISAMPKKIENDWIPVRLRTKEGEVWVAHSRSRLEKINCDNFEQAAEICYKNNTQI